jgi:hypothetical protein
VVLAVLPGNSYIPSISIFNVIVFDFCMTSKKCDSIQSKFISAKLKQRGKTILVSKTFNSIDNNETSGSINFDNDKYSLLSEEV